MRLKMVGTGSILTSALSSCGVVDEKLLVDVPNGAMKAMRRQGLKPSNLDACIITHFHADHYFDIVFLLLEQGLRNVRETPFTIAGPKGLEERVNILFDLAYPESWDRVRQNSLVEYHEWDEEGGTAKFGPYIVTAVPVVHRTPLAYGYIVRSGKATVGFSGDTELCDGVQEIVAASDLAVLDGSFRDSRSGHMGMSDVIALNERNPGTLIVATHLSDEVREATWDSVEIPEDGQEFEVSGSRETR